MAEQRRAFWDLQPAPPARPIDMVLHCPKCGMQHIDQPELTWKEALEATGRPVPPEAEAAHARKWTNPPHRSHLCRKDEGGCGTIWRPADVPTNGVAAIATRGKADTWPDGVQGMDEAAIRADERERCAQVCEAEAAGHRTAFGEHCAAVIRAGTPGVGVPGQQTESPAGTDGSGKGGE